METPEHREHGYDDEEEQRAYEERAAEEEGAETEVGSGADEQDEKQAG